MRLNIKVSEGKKRLRLLVSVLVAIATYIYFFVNEYRVNTGEALVGFPLLAALGFVLAFILITAAYWVIDGFEKENVKKYNVRNITGLELFEIADGASIEFQGKLISIAGLTKTENEKLDNINKMIIESWQQPALAYTFALTCICMLKNQKTFLQSSAAKDFAETVSDRLRYLSNKEAATLTDKKRDPIKSKDYSDSQVKRMIIGVLYFSENMMKRTKGTEPLQSLNDYVAEITGLKEPAHYEKITEAGKTLLGKINNVLA
jgi:hypothetical protein